jgi:hypothetical protein
MAADPNAQNASDLQQKFELYFLGLIFTILGFALQTSQKPAHISVAITELMAWAFLILCGIIGMYRLIWASVTMYTYSEINIFKATRAQIQGLSVARGILTDPAGNPIDIPSTLGDLNESIDKLEGRSTKQNKRSVFLFNVQLIIFIAALIMLFYSRGYTSLNLIFN